MGFVHLPLESYWSKNFTSILFPDVLSSDVCNQQMVSCPHPYLNFLQRNPISKVMKATIICQTL